MEITVCKTRPEHLDAICDIAVKAWTPIHESYRQLLGEEIYTGVYAAGWQERKRSNVRYEAEHFHSLVALAEGRVVGFLSFTVQGKMGEICGNAVDPDCRGMGIAGKLYDYALTQMKAMGCMLACVETGGDPGHASARRAYEKAGFQKNLPSVKYYKEL